MRGTAIIIVLLPVFMFTSCAEKSKPTGSAGPLFSVTVLDAEGNPAEGLRVGSINHPKGGNPAPPGVRSIEPCPATPIEFSLPQAGDWELTISDYNGTTIRILSGTADAGSLEIVWDGNNEDGESVPGGFYHYQLIAGGFEDDVWMVLETGPDPHQTIIGALDQNGEFTTDNIALFPGLINPQPVDYYTDTVTVHLSRVEFPNDFFYHVARLSCTGNSLSFILDSLGLPEALVKIAVIDTSGNPVPGINVGSMNHSYIDQTPKAMDPDSLIRIVINVAYADSVLLEVFDYYGRHVKTLVNEYYEAGSYQATWDFRDAEDNEVLCGYYQYVLTVGDSLWSKWFVYEKAPDPGQTIIGQTSTYGILATNDTLVFPGLLGNPPEIPAYSETGVPLGYFHYSDTVTFTLSDPTLPGQYLYFARRLSTGLNSFEFTWNPGILKRD